MKYKCFFLGSLLTVIVIALSCIISICFKSTEVINIKTIEGYKKINESLEEKINKVKNQNCQKSLNDMLERIDHTYFENDITIEEYYKTYFKDNKTFVSYFDEVMNSCNLSREDTDYIYVEALASTNYPNKIKEKYELRYEFILQDVNARKNYKIDNEVGTYTTKTLELRVLKNLIEEVAS